ncbi:IS110 family transposase [Candidatus Saccharibacteria bacterium]|nr:IS110 family transposase [Candidatus Saccharibacteria bacterium]
MYYVGIDIAKRFHEAAVIDERGKVIIKRIKFQNSHSGYCKLRDAVRKLNQPVEFAMEATGHYWFSLYAHLRQDNQTVRVINPLQSDALRGLFIHETKTDTIDAFIIAEVLRIGRYTKTEVLPENVHSLRELCRQRFYVIDMASDIKRKIIALLDQVFPEYEKLFTDIFGVTSMELLANYSTPEQMLSVDSQTLAELLQKASRGRFGIDKASQIQEYARNSFGIILASSSFSLIIKQYIEQLKSFESCIDIFDFEIAKIYDTFDCKLHTITGIGKTLAAVILSEIGGDISKFSSVPKLVAYAGLYPKNRQSGESIHSNGHISKRGSPYLRRAIWLASFVAAFKDPVIHQFYERKRADGKDHMNAMGHVCHKLLSIIFAVLRDNKPYNLT